MQAEQTRSNPQWIHSGRNDFLLDCNDGTAALEYLKTSPAQRRVVQMFRSPAQLIQFLNHPSAGICLNQERWQPWLMLPFTEATHAQQWCLNERASHWPWPLRFGKVTDGPSRAAACELGIQLSKYLEFVGNQLVRRLSESQYKSRPTPSAILACGHRPLRVLTVAMIQTSYQRYCARDISDGLRDCGVETVMFATRGNAGRQL